MNVGLPKHFLPVIFLCLILAAPIVATVAARVNDETAAIGTLASERHGLHCGAIAGSLLDATQRFRLALRLGARPPQNEVETAMRRFAASCATLEGPRTRMTDLRALEVRMLARGDPATAQDRIRLFSEYLLTEFFDLEDRSGLTYDTNVDAINIVDALMSRSPFIAERLEQAAQIVRTAALRGLARREIMDVERLVGSAQEVERIANDDFGTDWSTTPVLKEQLDSSRVVAARAQERLARGIDAQVLGSSSRTTGLQQLRWASIAASHRLRVTLLAVMDASFDVRLAAHRTMIRLTIAGGAAALGLTAALVALLWRALRRRDRAELERTQERAQTLETQLARRNAERALRLTEAQFRAVFDGSHVGIAIVDRDGRRIDANPALHKLFGTDLKLIMAKTTQMFGQVVRDGRDSVRTEDRFEGPNGACIWAELSLSIIRAGSEDVVSAIVLVHDITEHKTLNARLDYETLHDALTTLPNRVHFIRRLDTMINAGDEPFAVAFIDLDRFKAVNDTLGHHAGDEILRTAARRLSAEVRPCDVVARLHGDEFAVLLRGLTAQTDGGEIDAIVGRLRTALDISVETPQAPLRISASIGYVGDGSRYADAEELLRNADSAMYRSKVGGRDRVTRYETAATEPLPLV